LNLFLNGAKEGDVQSTIAAAKQADSH
jgi:hypothetical protein